MADDLTGRPDCQMPCDEDCEIATPTGSSPPVHCWNWHRPSHKPDWHDPAACDAQWPPGVTAAQNRAFREMVALTGELRLYDD
jgi:hypothetical protein